ncbi:hypothetical protein CVT91_01200 [Candidatus Atribacteria bacterium HGW-Atribacteria-1]|nr:MAG: hypothetical protein CVT91_01200 [Candidatus Atribacteria bacterium HGW-Atribacteria-1]
MNWFKLIFKKLMKLILRIINEIIFVKKNIIIFMSVPDFSDNSKAFYDYIATQKMDYELVWLVREKNYLDFLKNKGVKVFYFRSFKGLIKLLLSKYIITTHIVFLFKSNQQKLINLWHGMTFKTMGFLDKTETRKSLKLLKIQNKNTDVLISTSQNMKNAMSACFYIDPRKIIITGQPRNDIFFRKDDQKHIFKIFSKEYLSKFSKLLLYAPTFRQRKDIFCKRIDGNIFKTDIFRFNGIDDYHEELENFLDENNFLLIIKLHPFEEELFIKKGIKLPKNVMILKNRSLVENNLIINDILKYIDILLTDYSSIYFDFLLLNRPIIFVVPDLDKYKSARNFALEPFTFWMPGKIVKSFEELKDSIIAYSNDCNIDQEKRRMINSLVNKYSDGNSSKRIWDKISNLK